jgi:hypothetical protein
MEAVLLGVSMGIENVPKTIFNANANADREYFVRFINEVDNFDWFEKELAKVLISYLKNLILFRLRFISNDNDKIHFNFRFDMTGSLLSKGIKKAIEMADNKELLDMFVTIEKNHLSNADDILLRVMRQVSNNLRQCLGVSESIIARNDYKDIVIHLNLLKKELAE